MAYRCGFLRRLLGMCPNRAMGRMRSERQMSDEERQEIYENMQSDMSSGEAWFIQDERRGGYSVATNHRVVNTFDDFDKAVRFVGEEMTRQKVFSNVYYINERGNVDVLAVSVGKRLKSGFVPVKWKTVASFV